MISFFSCCVFSHPSRGFRVRLFVVDDLVIVIIATVIIIIATFAVFTVGDDDGIKLCCKYVVIQFLFLFLFLLLLLLLLLLLIFLFLLFSLLLLWLFLLFCLMIDAYDGDIVEG